MKNERKGNEDEHIISHLNNGRLGEAFKSIESMLVDFETFSNDIISQQSQYIKYEDAKVSNTLYEQESQVIISRIGYSLRKILQKFQDETLKGYFNINSFHDEIIGIEDQDALLIKVLKLRVEPMGYLIPETEYSRQGDGAFRIIKGNTSIFVPLKKIESGTDALAQVMRKTKLCAKEKEAFQNLMGLKHRNIIKVIDYQLLNYPFFLIKERIYGKTLSISLQTVGRRPASQVADWMYQLSDALLYLNQKGIQHFNVRPSKIFIDDEFNVMISPLDLLTLNQDFEDKTWFYFQSFWEVCKYGSPEFLSQYGPGKTTNLNTRFVCSDLQFSLGAVAFYALTGEELFSGFSVTEILQARRQFEESPQSRLHLLDNLSEFDNRCNALKDIVIKLLSIKPEERYKTLHALIREIHRLIHADFNTTFIAQTSYRRALATNRGLIHEFYKHLFNKSKLANEVFHKIKDEKLLMNKQYSMLQMAIDVVLNHQDEKYTENLRRVLLHSHSSTSANIHSKLDMKEYEIFMDSLICAVKDSDPEFSGKPEIAEAWRDTSDIFMKNVKAIFSEGDGNA